MTDNLPDYLEQQNNQSDQTWKSGSLPESFKKSNNHNSNKKYLLGFELWEVMTAFTIALTIASSLMWFSNLQPRNIQSEFVLQDQYKSSLYNLWVQTEHLKSQAKALYLPPEASQCYAGFANKDIQISEAEDYIQEIEALKIKNSEIGESIQKVDRFISPEISLQSVSTSFRGYLQTFVDGQNETLKLAKATLTSQQLVSQSCTQGWTLPPKDIVTLKANLMIIKDLGKANNLQDLDKLGDLIFADSTAVEEVVWEESEKSQLEALSQSVWSLNYLDIRSQSKLLEQEDRLILNFKDYESWQKEFVSQNSFLAAKVVYIFD
jgi:hypothetical protein